MTSSLEDIKTIDLEQWLTLATAPAPTKLKLGQSPAMENVWTDEKPGSVVTSKGLIKVGAIPSGNPISFCIDYFKSSTGVQIFVVSDGATVWTTVDFQNFTSIITGLSSSFQLRGLVVRDELWLTNGSDPVQNFDGTNVRVLDGTSGLPNVPRGRYIAYHDERVWLFHTSSTRSAVYFSSLTDPSGNIISPRDINAWNTANNFLQISEGDADFGTGMILYRGYLFFFKQYSIWRLVGYDEYTYSRVKTRASTGTRFNESVQILDSLVHFIGIDGIYVFDGEEAERISDIIDPGTASQTFFGFDGIQQPNSNNQFWEVTQTADWNTGTVPTNLEVDNSLTLEAADDTQADFAAGTTQTNVDTTTNPGFLQLALVASGGSSNNISQGKPATLTDGDGVAQIGSAPLITDGDFINLVGFSNTSNADDMLWAIDLGSSFAVGQAILKGLYIESVGSGTSGIAYNFARIEYSNDNVNWSTAATVPAQSVTNHAQFTNGVLYTHNAGSWQSIGPVDVTLNFSTIAARFWRLHFQGNPAGYVITELQIFQAGFKPTGSFVSKTLDYGAAPNSFGFFNANFTLNGGTASYFTQSSNDNVTYDAPVSCTNGGAVGSTIRRYLRWGVNLTSGAGGVTSPIIDSVFLAAQYLSAIHNTGGNIFTWGPFESDYVLNGEPINFYYRTAITSPGVSAATWNLIVPGGVISDPTINQFVQFKIEFPVGLPTNLPVVNSVTINWVVGTGQNPQTLQNVASAYWKNRYWLSAAGPSATSNDTILIRGKKTFGNPWMLKNWKILSFTRFFDSLYGGSSIDGSIYQLDSGYSLAGVAMDSFFETGDFTFGGFTANFIEAIVEVERLGMWSIAVGYSVDGGNTWVDTLIDLSLSTFDSNFSKRLNINVTTTRIRFRFRTNGTDTPFQVHRFIAFYKLETERGSIRGDYMPA